MLSNVDRPTAALDAYSFGMPDSLAKLLQQEDSLRAVLGRNLRDARLNKEMTQQDVADRFGVNKGTVSAWEKGRGDPGAVRLRSLCRLYGIPMDSAFSDKVLSPASVEIATQFEGLNERQRATVLGLWSAYTKGEQLPQPPQENKAQEDDLARQIITRSSNGAEAPPAKGKRRGSP